MGPRVAGVSGFSVRGGCALWGRVIIQTGTVHAATTHFDADGNTIPANIEFIFKDWFECESVDVDPENFSGLVDFAFMLAEFARDKAAHEILKIGLV